MFKGKGCRTYYSSPKADSENTLISYNTVSGDDVAKCDVVKCNVLKCDVVV
jgi:hypothetical protein